MCLCVRKLVCASVSSHVCALEGRDRVRAGVRVYMHVGLFDYLIL